MHTDKRLRNNWEKMITAFYLLNYWIMFSLFWIGFKRFLSCFFATESINNPVCTMKSFECESYESVSQTIKAFWTFFKIIQRRYHKMLRWYIHFFSKLRMMKFDFQFLRGECFTCQGRRCAALGFHADPSLASPYQTKNYYTMTTARSPFCSKQKTECRVLF